MIAYACSLNTRAGEAEGSEDEGQLHSEFEVSPGIHETLNLSVILPVKDSYFYDFGVSELFF